MRGRPISVLLSLPLLLACAPPMVPLAGPDDDFKRVSVSVGDTVRVLTKYGERPIFEVTDITEDALVGENQRIPYSEMAFLELKQGRTLDRRQALTAVLVLTAGAVAFERVLESIPPGMGTAPP